MEANSRQQSDAHGQKHGHLASLRHQLAKYGPNSVDKSMDIMDTHTYLFFLLLKLSIFAVLIIKNHVDTLHLDCGDYWMLQLWP
jgi:hypothetical protein